MTLPLTIEQLETAMAHAVREAERFIGATAPNPPVGAAALAADGKLLGVAAHERAGTAHAEAKLIAELSAKKLLPLVHTLVVTLEPCNHQGRTPPCTSAIIASGIKHVAFACQDPNPKVSGAGSERLSAAGILVTPHILESKCQQLIEKFAYWCKQERPWLIVKQALDTRGSMIPPPGQKTFTSPDSIRFAHELRRESDAILTGSGTILADDPLFTVRAIEDIPDKKRWLLVFDRRQRLSSQWRAAARERGFLLLDHTDPALSSLESALHFLGKQGCHLALLEAGPELTASALQSGLWNQHVVIQQSLDGPDQIIIRSNRHVYGDR